MSNGRNRNKLYNYIVNTYGIGPNEVKEMIQERLKEVFDNDLTLKIEAMIRNKVDSEIREKYNKHIGSYILQYIDKAVQKEVEKLTKQTNFEGKIKIDFNPRVSVNLKTEREIELEKKNE
jgi:uncharacterized FAD-dependent dehydrogenase